MTVGGRWIPQNSGRCETFCGLIRRINCSTTSLSAAPDPPRGRRRLCRPPAHTVSGSRHQASRINCKPFSTLDTESGAGGELAAIRKHTRWRQRVRPAPGFRCRNSGGRQRQRQLTVSVAVSVTVSVSEGRVRGSDPAARPRRPPPGRPMSTRCRPARCQREPSQPRRHQDTKKTTKDSFRVHLGSLVSWWFSLGRVGLDHLQALPSAMTLRAVVGSCRCQLPLPQFPATATATATVPAAVDPVDLHRRMLSGRAVGKSEIRNPKWAGGWSTPPPRSRGGGSSRSKWSGSA